MKIENYAPINGEIFRAYVEQHLILTRGPGDLVIKDDLSAHKVEGIRQMIDAVGAKLTYLPPYSHCARIVGQHQNLAGGVHPGAMCQLLHHAG